MLALSCGVKDTPPNITAKISMQTPDNAPGPSIGEVVAVEIEVNAENRRHTRNSVAISAILQAMGPSAAWTKGY